MEQQVQLIGKGAIRELNKLYAEGCATQRYIITAFLFALCNG